MNFIQKTLIKVDRAVDLFENLFCGLGTLLITGMITVAIVARFCFGHAFPWLEELAQYIMVWIVCLGGILCTKDNDHVSVDVVFSLMPKRFHHFYKIILKIVSIVFLAIFSFYAWRTVVMIKKNGQFSVTMPWFKMYWLYVGVLVGTVLMCYEFIKLCYHSICKKDNDLEDDIPLEKLEKP